MGVTHSLEALDTNHLPLTTNQIQLQAARVQRLFSSTDHLGIFCNLKFNFWFDYVHPYILLLDPAAHPGDGEHLRDKLGDTFVRRVHKISYLLASKQSQETLWFAFLYDLVYIRWCFRKKGIPDLLEGILL